MRIVKDKWVKFAVLKAHRDVAKHIPAMCAFTPAALKEMLVKFSLLVAKPKVGTGGRGLVKIERLSGDKYRCHYGESIKELESLDALTAELDRIREGRAYMLQQGIRLATIQGRPVDYRVKMVKEGGSWKITAVVGRWAKPGLFVTNLCKGGTLLSGTEALRRCFPKKLVRDKKATMRGVARTCTFLLERKYPGLGALGYDFGIDKKGTVWILEVNTRPH